MPSSASPPAQTPQGQPCLTGVGNNPLIVIKHHQCTVSSMPKARRSRLSLTRCAGGATLLRISTSVALNHRKPLRRLQRQPLLSGEPFVYGAALLRLSPHRFLSMELAHTEARSPKTTIRAHFNIWWARTMKRCSYNLIASGWHLPALNSGLWLSAGSAPTFP